jgi:2-isopropylmalate synthase
MLQNRATYEIMKPDDVGYVGTNLVLGKHSGRHAFRDRVNSLGFALEPDVFERVFNEFIALCDKKKDVYDADIAAIIESHLGETSDVPDRWKLVSVHTSAGAGTIPTATVELQCENEPPRRDAATGDGPLDAIFLAMKRITGVAGTLRNFQVRSVSSGEDAQGESFVEILVNDKSYHGKGISTDIIQASAEAYLKALNRAMSDKQPAKRVLAQHD